MADATSNRPRPRPRPKAIAKKPADGIPSATPGASSSSTIPSQGTQAVIEVNDTDDMFIINRNRSAKTWQKLEELNKEVSKSSRANSDSDEDLSPRRKKKKRNPSAVPSWQKTKNIERMLSQDLSEDDSDPEVVEISDLSSTPNGKRKEKRKRSRSRSITPPPALPLHQIQNAKNVVRQALASRHRAPSPTFMINDPDDSTDTIILQPELRAIAKAIENRSQHSSGTSQVPATPSDDHIVLSVKWQPHPLDQNGKVETWQYQINRNDDFRELFDAAAEDAAILVDRLVLTYQGKRFFSSVTPQTLKIWSDTADLVASDTRTYDYIRANPHSVQHNLFVNASQSQHTVDSANAAGTSGAPEPAQTQESDAESESDEDKFKLILRSGATGSKNITLTVRPTTKCGAIVKAFLKKAGLADQYPEVFVDATAVASKKKGGKKSKNEGPVKDPRLCVDGDKMDNQAEIGDADLEDGDMVEVVDL